ncbi:MAG: methylenetetrahydrofolate reductase [Pseudomonadota bacterium]
MSIPLTSLEDAFSQERFALIGQLRLHQDDGRLELLEQARTLAPAVDAVAITDCPYGVLHLSALAGAAMLLEAGIDPLINLTARDRNRIALKSELLGAAALGVRNLLLQRGDRLPGDVQPSAKQVFDTGGKRMLSMAKQLSDFGVAKGSGELLLGTLATVFDPEAHWRPQELTAKVDAGARFVQTQICLDVELLTRYIKFLIAAKLTWKCKIIVSVPVLSSAESARWLFENVRGSVIPESVVRGFEAASDPHQYGVDYCADLLRQLKDIPGVSGANLSTPGDASLIVAAIEQAQL